MSTHLIERSDLVGDLHSHTNHTDGLCPMDEMAVVAQSLGLQYIAFTDHSKRAHMCNGLSERQLLKQWEDYAPLREEMAEQGFTILKGIEVDILEQGGLDIADEVLAQADWVVASLHFGRNQDKAQITRRLLDAIENPHVCVIGHPTGRYLPDYPAYDADWDLIFNAAAENGCFFELNSHPKRLDLSVENCERAKELGIKIVISSDSHNISALEYPRMYGIEHARKAGLTPDDVANTKPWPELKKLLRKKA
ncbi:MAG: PHP domain-containing protein [Thermoguttaceae bacterium]